MNAGLLFYIAAHISLIVVVRLVLRLDHALQQKDHELLCGRYYDAEIEFAKNLRKPPFLRVPIVSRVFRVESPNRLLWVRCTGFRHKTLTVLESSRTSPRFLLEGRLSRTPQLIEGVN